MTTLIGTAGATLILIAFVLNQFHVWKDDDLLYDTVNFVGAALLVTYAVLLGSWPFAVLNGVWTIVSLRDAFLDVQRKHRRP